MTKIALLAAGLLALAACNTGGNFSAPAQNPVENIAEPTDGPLTNPDM